MKDYREELETIVCNIKAETMPLLEGLTAIERLFREIAKEACKEKYCISCDNDDEEQDKCYIEYNQACSEILSNIEKVIK